MIKLRSLSLCAFASVLVFSAVLQAQQAAPAAARIVNPIDESQLVTLTHAVHPLANAANDRGAAPDGMRLDRMHLFLQRSPSQETALHQLISQMNAPGSPSYHQWLTPQQFGEQFGPADQDISAVTTWLGNHGFSVTRVSAGKGSIEFSGSVGQLREAFHTQIHKYVVNGETHYANANNPQIPAALAPVIGGFTSLNNFRVKSYAHKLGQASFNTVTHQATPTSNWTYGNSSGYYFAVAPGDFAAQYDVAPLYTAGVTGTGQTIAIINDSNINVNFVNQFRTLFNLPANPPQVVIDGNDPGVDGINNPDGPNYDSVEAYLDVEWSGAVAPGATIDLVIAADTSLESGLVLAMEHAIDGNIAPVVSLSFGACESNLGSTNAFINSLWEQGAAQGQTIMVSAGDAGSAVCDNDDTQEYAMYGQAVNGFASTPYNVAVGGTDFYYSDYSNSTTLPGQLATYWNSTPTQLPGTSLLTPIPEQPWNDSQYGLNIYNQYTATGTTSIAAGSGGASTCATGTYDSSGDTVTCGGGYTKPSWQTGTGVPTDGVRDLPDVSLFAANGSNESYYALCAVDGDCQSPTGNNLVQISGVGGTSASSPAFAAIMALINQKYGRQGVANTILYPLKKQYPAAFHDVVNGTNTVPCQIGTADCISVTSPAVVGGITEGEIGTGTTAEYNAAAGYNLATGLGTIDANVMATDWNKITLAGTTTTMTPSSTSFAHGTAITVSGGVTGTGTPTGNVALMTDSTEPLQQGQGVFPLTSGAYSSGTVSYLPGGTYHLWANYGGDSNNGMSASTKTSITVTPETPGMNFNLFNAAQGQYFTPTSNPGTQVDYGTQLMLSSEVAPVSQLPNLQSCVISGTNCSSLSYTTPTGTVTFNDGSNAINTAVMNAEGDAEYNAPFAVGTHTITAIYNGDQSYNKFTSAAIPFTVIKDSPQLFYNASNVNSSGQIISGQATAFNVIVENNAQYNAYSSSSGAAIAPVPVLPPTGTVTLSSTPAGISGSTTLSASVDPADGAQSGVGVINLPATLTAGNYTVTFTYSGDANYVGESGPGTITVVGTSGLQASTTAATMTGGVSPNTSIIVTGTVTGVSGHPAPTGGIIFFSSGNDIGEIALTAPATGTVSTFAATLDSQSLFQGANFVTLQYTGDTVYSPSATTLNSGSSIANPLSDFSLIPNSTIVPVSVSSGIASGTVTVNVASVNGFTGAVNLTCSAPAPLTCGITPNPTLSSGGSATSTLTINVPPGTANGNFSVAVIGTSGEYVHTLGITADVAEAVTTPNFALSSSGNITITGGATTGNTSIMSVTPSNGFTGAVALTCAVTTAPGGATSPVTCTVQSPVNITGTGAVTATLTASSTATTTAGAYVITVTGVSGSITQTAAVNVTVNAAAAASVTLAASTPAAVSPGSNATSTITVTGSGGYAGSVALSCALTTSPSGATDLPSCAITGSPVTLGASATATATVTTTAATTGDLIVPKIGNGKGWLGAGSGALLALVVFFGIPARRRSWRAILGIFVMLAALGALSSCGGGVKSGSGSGGGGTSNPGTTAGSYTFTVTATGTPAVTPAPTTTFTVSVN